MMHQINHLNLEQEIGNIQKKLIMKYQKKDIYLQKKEKKLLMN